MIFHCSVQISYVYLNEIKVVVVVVVVLLECERECLCLNILGSLDGIRTYYLAISFII